jgi:hypothetical protein
MYRSVWFRHDEDNSFTNVAYTVKDERRPLDGGKVRQIERKTTNASSL